MNISLLSKWWWKPETEDGLWLSIVKAKYMQGNNLITTIKHKADDSPIWSDLLKIRQFYLKGRFVTTKNGQSTLFWEDPWLHQKPLCILHPVLYDICQDKNISVHTFILKQAQLSFSRWLPPILFDSWVSLIDEIYAYPFANSADEISWKGERMANSLQSLFMTCLLLVKLVSLSSLFGKQRSHTGSNSFSGYLKIR